MKVFLISGKAQSGKSTIAKKIETNLSKKYKVCNIEIMRTLKGYLKDYFNWDGKEETKPRDLLQQMGTELIREKMNMPLFHIERLIGDIKVLSNFYDIFIVDDIRLPIEIEYLKKEFDVISIKVISNNKSNLTEQQQKHKTEIMLDDYNNFDYIINNNDFNKLDDIINDILKEVIL